MCQKVVWSLLFKFSAKQKENGEDWAGEGWLGSFKERTTGVQIVGFIARCKFVDLHPAQVADLIVKRMVAAQTRGEEDRMGEILVLLDRYFAH